MCQSDTHFTLATSLRTERTKMTELCPADGHYFGCVGSPCLALYKVCDGTNDCLYGTDENPRVCGKERFVKAGEGFC